MKKIAAALALVLASLTLTSCVKMDINLIVNEDATVSGYTIFAFEKSLAEMAGSDSSSPADDLINTDAKGVTVTKYDQDGFVGEKYTFQNVPFSEFSKSSSAEGQLAFTLDGNLVSVTGALDFTSGDGSEESDPYTDSIAKSMMALAQLDIAITFPGKIVKTTGQISEDGHTVTWTPVLGEKLDLATTVELPGGTSLILPLAGLAALVAAGAVIFLIARRKKSAVLEVVEAE